MHNRPINLLNPQIFLDYLRLYPKYREKDRISVFGIIKGAAGRWSSTVTRQEAVNEKLDKIILEVEAEINAAKDFKSWHKLIFTIREKAQTAQGFKTLNEPALSSLTLHALAGFIILELYKVSDDLINHVNGLKSQLIELDKKKQDDIGNQGKGVEKINEDIKKIIFELAMLGDLYYANEAIERQLLDPAQFKLPDAMELIEYGCSNTGGNFASPLCLQVGLCEWLYQKKFQSITKVSFSEFRLDAIDNSEFEHRKKAEEEKAKGRRLQELENAHRIKREMAEIAEKLKQEEMAKTDKENKTIQSDDKIPTVSMLQTSGNSTPLITTQAEMVHGTNHDTNSDSAPTDDTPDDDNDFEESQSQGEEPATNALSVTDVSSTMYARPKQPSDGNDQENAGEAILTPTLGN